MEWFALVIPLLGVIVAAVLWKTRLVWWEVVVPIVLGVAVIAIAKGTTKIVQVSDTEYWTGYAVEARYYEDWNERVSCSHTKYCEDSDGNSYACGTEHAYDVDDHPPYWEVVDNNGLAVRTNERKFEELCQRWANDYVVTKRKKQTHTNREFVELNRDYHTDDGDMYRTRWPGDDLTMEVVTTSHQYENRPAAATDVYRFNKVSKEDRKKFGLFEYPEIDGYTSPSILGAPGIPGRSQAERNLAVSNAKLGQTKQIKMFVLLFVDQPKATAREQEAHWKRGNKNELVTCIGLDKSHNVRWVHVFSWTERSEIMIRTRDFVSASVNKPLDLVSFVNWLAPQVEQNWVRKRFREFSYLSVPMPTWALITTWVLVILATVGLIWWEVSNQYDAELSERYRFPRRR